MSKTYKINKLEQAGLKHYFFTKAYGNISYFYGKDKIVNKNRQKVAQELGIKRAGLYEMEQIHSNNLKIIKKNNSKKYYRKCDGLITDLKNIHLFLKTADCFPVIIFEPVKKILGLLHVGWQGCIQHIVEKTVLKLVAKFAVEPENLIAGIGPGIRKCCYKFENIYQENILEWQEFIGKQKRFKSIDLPGFIKKSLKDAGINTIYDIKICTKCNKDFFSHYQSKQTREKKGLFATVAVLK